MELTMTRLLLLTIVSAVLPVSIVSANPWGTRANKRAELQDALDFLKKHLSDNGVDLAAGSRPRVNTGGFPGRQQMSGSALSAADNTKPVYDQRFNSGNQRETADLEPVEMLINEQMASEDDLSELESADLDLEDSISSEGALVDDLIADIIAKEILDELEQEPSDDNTLDYGGYTADEIPTAVFDYNQEMENYERFLAQRMEDQDETPIDNDILDNEIDDDILNEVMMTFLEDTDEGNELTRNNILSNELSAEDSDEEPLLTEEEEEEIIVAENILREIEDELKREKIKQESLSKKKALKAAPQAAPASCPILDYLVDDCEIAAVDGIGGDGYRQAFRVPCNWHQICYTCGYGYGISQEICDEAFYLEMLSRCGRSQTCNDRADFFLLAVVEDRVPLLKSPSVCQRPCVSEFLLGLDE